MTRARRKKRKASRSRARKAQAWTLLSQIIRWSAADKNGWVRCVTCGKLDRVENMQAGHFIPAGRGNAVKWDRRNIHPQCPQCNIFKHGNLIEYYPWMLARYGHKIIDDLRGLSAKPLKLSISDYDGMVDDYREELAEIMRRRKS